MRISTASMHQLGYDAIAKNQTDLYQIEAQMASGKRINSAADDPAGAARAADLQSSLSVNSQYGRNQTSVQNTLQFSESVVGNIGDAIQTIGDTLVQAGNGALSASDKKSIAADLKGQLSQLVNLANTKDEAGHYLFSGFNTSAAPFSQGPGGISYSGDNGQRSVQVSGSSTLLTNVPGSELFLNVKGGNGIIETAAGAANTGTGQVDNGSVLDPIAYDGSNFSVAFSNTAGGLVYNVTNTTTGTTVLSAQPYVAGHAIQIPLAPAGSPVVSLSISGTPSAGDQFSLSGSSSTNVFDAVNQAIDALNNNAGGTISNTALSDLLRRTQANVSQSLDRTLQVRGQFGNSMAELTRQQTVNSSADTDIKSRLSSVQDLDYAKAASDLSQAQLAYQASQQVYSKLAKQSLFDYL